MRLERLEATQRPEKLKAVFDGEALTVSASLCVQFSLCAGMELDEEAFSALKAAVAKEAARERAVRILTASAVSERELEKRLLQKGMLPSDAADAVAWLKEHRFLDDAATAAQLVDSAVRKGYGRARVKNILYEKGIPKDLWEEALARIPRWMTPSTASWPRSCADGRRMRRPSKKQLMRCCAAAFPMGRSATRCGVMRQISKIWKKQ